MKDTLVFKEDDEWFSIMDWINSNTTGNVKIVKHTTPYFHAGLARYLHDTYFRVKFSNPDDILFCKIKFPQAKHD